MVMFVPTCHELGYSNHEPVLAIRKLSYGESIFDLVELCTTQLGLPSDTTTLPVVIVLCPCVAVMRYGSSFLEGSLHSSTRPTPRL